MKLNLRRPYLTVPVWRPLNAVYPRPDNHTKALLTTKQSLTQLCLQACPSSFEVRPVHQCWGRARHHEAALLAINPDAIAFVRHVELRCQQNVWIYARTVVPRTTLTGRRRRLLHLGNRSLGAFLFTFKDLKRITSEYASLSPAQLQRLSGLEVSTTVWARRQVYDIQSHRLLITEIFLHPEALGVTREPYRR